MAADAVVVHLDALLLHILAPEQLVVPSAQKAKVLASLLKQLYDATVAVCGRHYGPFEELFVDGLDSESIWEELQLSNKPLIAAVKKHVQKINKRLAKKAAEERARAEAEARAAEEDSDDEEDEQDDEENAGENSEEDDDDGEEDEEDEEAAPASKIDNQFIARMLGKQTADDEEDDEDDEEEDEEEDDDEEEQGDEDKEPDMRHVGVGEDQFFDLDEMERYIGEEEDKYMRREAKKTQKLMAKGHDGVNDDDDDLDGDEDEEEDDELDLFAGADEDEDEDEDGADLRYEDFWGNDTSSTQGSKKQKKETKEKKAKKPVKQAELDEEDEEEDDKEEGHDNELFDGSDGEDGEDFYDDEDDDDEGSRKAKTANSEQLSSYEKAQLKMKEKIAQIEAELIGEKPWQMAGEVEGRMRPENSLLSAMIVDMERASKPTPVITVEKTATLEDLIKKRILDQHFDDVIPREITNAALKPGAAVELPEVSKEKSKEGLGEIYEKEFLKQTLGVQESDPLAGKKEEILKAFQKLCRKLDALTHFHYAPKPVVADVQINTNVPAIHMEEILPLAVSQGDAAAPEEVYEKKRGREGAFQSAEEMTQVDRKRARRAKKEERRKEKRREEYEQRLVARVNPGMGNKYEKEKLLKEIRGDKRVVTGEQSTTNTKGLTNSTTFFRNLQESVQSAANAAKQGQSAGDQGKKSSSKKTSHFKL